MEKGFVSYSLRLCSAILLAQLAATALSAATFVNGAFEEPLGTGWQGDISWSDVEGQGSRRETAAVVTAPGS